MKSKPAIHAVIALPRVIKLLFTDKSICCWVISRYRLEQVRN